MLCEYCGITHTGNYGSGRFCCASCARKFSSKTNRDITNRKISESLKVYYVENKEAVRKRKMKRKTKKKHIEENTKLKINKQNKKAHIIASFMFSNMYMAGVPNYPDYIVDINGNIFNKRLNKYLKQFSSNGYKQVVLRNNFGRVVKGVHQVVAMSFLDEYFEGCVVHHIDENKQNNNLLNLECLTVTDHAKYHANAEKLIQYSKTHAPHNKGKKMSKEFCEHCRQSALKRWKNKK